jgi:hypothetical protein
MTEDNQSALRAYAEGRNAFRDGHQEADCPYLEDGPALLILNWHCGYEDAFSEYAESFAGW